MTIKQALNKVAEEKVVKDLMKEIDEEIIAQQSAVYHKTANFTRLKSLVKRMENLFESKINPVAKKNKNRIPEAIHFYVKESFWDEAIEEDFEIA